MAIVAMASDQGKMTMDKMKLNIKFKFTFGTDEYLRKKRTYLVNSINFWLNLLNLQGFLYIKWSQTD